MINSLKVSLENEDVLFALTVDTYKTLLRFLFKAFSIEKVQLER